MGLGAGVRYCAEQCRLAKRVFRLVEPVHLRAPDQVARSRKSEADLEDLLLNCRSLSSYGARRLSIRSATMKNRTTRTSVRIGTLFSSVWSGAWLINGPKDFAKVLLESLGADLVSRYE